MSNAPIMKQQRVDYLMHTSHAYRFTTPPVVCESRLVASISEVWGCE